MEVTTIRQKTIVPAEPEEVYDAFLDSKKHFVFTGSRATVVPRIGGRFTAGDGYISGRNLELEKGKRIVQEWQTTEWPSGYPPSRLELTFEKVKGGTEISMTHSNVPAEQAEYYREGWIEYYWTPLKKYFQKKQNAK